MKLILAIVPGTACHNPILPIDGTVVGQIWTGIMEWVEPTHTHFVNNEEGREWCLPICYIEGNSFPMILLNIDIGAGFIGIID